MCNTLWQHGASPCLSVLALTTWQRTSPTGHARPQRNSGDTPGQLQIQPTEQTAMMTTQRKVRRQDRLPTHAVGRESGRDRAQLLGEEETHRFKKARHCQLRHLELNEFCVNCAHNVDESQPSLRLLMHTHHTSPGAVLRHVSRGNVDQIQIHALPLLARWRRSDTCMSWMNS